MNHERWCQTHTVPITILRGTDGLYTAELTPPHGGRTDWKTPTPLPLDELIGALLERGCHQTDVGDAFYRADPDWLSRDNPNTEDDAAGRGNP